MMHEYYHTIERVVASYNTYADAQRAAAALRKGGRSVKIVPNPAGVDAQGSIKYKFLLVMKITVITDQKTLVW